MTDPRDQPPQHEPVPGTADSDDATATQRYLDLVRTALEEWTNLESQGDSSVQLSRHTLSTIKESVRAEVRHGAQVEMPPTDAGPYTLSELALRTLIRSAVDSVPGALALRARFDCHDSAGRDAPRGRPRRVACRISAEIRTPDLIELAERVRSSVLTACESELDLHDIVVDIHIEDLHDRATR